jgi:hypothetical protein
MLGVDHVIDAGANTGQFASGLRDYVGFRSRRLHRAAARVCRGSP